MISEKFFPLLEKLQIVKFTPKEKYYFLSYIMAISNAGQDERKAVQNKIYEYEKTGKSYLLYKMKLVKAEIDKGRRFSQALFNAGLINEREFHILTTSKGGMAAGIEKIIESSKRTGKSKIALTLLLTPPSIMIVMLLIFHQSVKDVLVGSTSQIVSAGGKPPPLPAYLDSPNTYIAANVIYWSIIVGIGLFIYFVKKNTPSMYLKTVGKVIPVIEEEYTLDILKSLQNVMSGGGINLSNAAKALANGESDNVRKKIFDTIVARTSIGKEKISDVFEEFGINYNTISALKIGEESTNIQIGIDIALEDIEKRYTRDIKIFTQIGLWGGQLSMLGIAGKPMIDIMLLMSVGQLNFQVN